MGRRRFAVVVYVPKPVAAEVDALRKAFGDTSIRRIAPHVTLIPPVNVRDEDAAGAVAAVESAAADTEPFGLTLGPPGTFLPATPVLYLEAGDSTARAALRALRDRAFVAPLARPIGREFEPHVTLGRAPKAPYRIEAGITAFGEYRIDVLLDRLTLTELLHPDDGPAVWTPIHEAPLGGPDIVARGPMEVELFTTAVIPDDALALFDTTFEPSGVVVDESGAGIGAAPAHVQTQRRVEREAPPDQVVIMARRDGELLGVLVGRKAGDWSTVDVVAVVPEHRRQGVAGHLRGRFHAG
ncbi:MAG: GNAT family N-acetyltransferase [Acidimicrobiales bacterium]